MHHYLKHQKHSPKKNTSANPSSGFSVNKALTANGWGKKGFFSRSSLRSNNHSKYNQISIQTVKRYLSWIFFLFSFYLKCFGSTDYWNHWWLPYLTFKQLFLCHITILLAISGTGAHKAHHTFIILIVFLQSPLAIKYGIFGFWF